MKLDLVFSGIGGQGVVVSSDIFCEAALLDGLDVAKAEIHGMAQRGGSIIAHIRVGEKVQAPLIEKGKAHIVLGFEMLETARALPMLSKDGIVIMNTKYILPNTCFDNSKKIWSKQELFEIIKKRANSVYGIDGSAIAIKLGNIRVANTVLLGALSAVLKNSITQVSWETAIASRLKKKYVNLNIKAFQIGREQVALS